MKADVNFQLPFTMWRSTLFGLEYFSQPVFTVMKRSTIIKKENRLKEDGNLIIFLNYASVVGVPKFFTPNNDTYNDVWAIENIEFYPNSVIQIFDRFGKLLKQIDPQNGWDGTFMGKNMPSDDYWFIMQLNNTRTIKGHFSLKR